MIPDISFYWCLSLQTHLSDQPMVQGVSSSFKTFFLGKAVAQVIAAHEEDIGKTLMRP